MAFKDVLLALTAYPEPTSVSALEDAADIAAALGQHPPVPVFLSH